MRGNHQLFKVPFYLFPSPGTEFHFMYGYWTATKSHCSTQWFYPLFKFLQFAVFVSSKKIQLLIPSEDSHGKENRRDHHTNPQKDGSTDWPTASSLGSEKPEDSKHKTLVEISFIHRRKRHVPRWARAMYAGSHGWYVSSTGQHRAVDCSIPLGGGQS